MIILWAYVILADLIVFILAYRKCKRVGEPISIAIWAAVLGWVTAPVWLIMWVVERLFEGIAFLVG